MRLVRLSLSYFVNFVFDAVMTRCGALDAVQCVLFFSYFFVVIVWFRSGQSQFAGLEVQPGVRQNW